MGTAFASGEFLSRKPRVVTRQFLTWLAGVFNERAGQAPLEREVTVYIGQGPTAGTGTLGDPYLRANAADLKTLMDSLYTTHAGSTLRIRIARGTAWQNRAPKAINVTRASVTVDSYGSGHAPIFHGTETLGELGVASVGSPVGGVYTITLGSSEMSGKTFRGLIPDWGTDPTALAEWDLSDPGLAYNVHGTTGTKAGRTSVYRRRATAAAVTGQGQFHYDSGTRVLTLYPHTGVTPTTTNLRVDTYVNSSLTGMIESGNFDSVRFEGLCVIGTGGNTGTDQCWAIFCAQAGTNAVVVKDCLLLYAGQHTLGLYNGSSGGCLVVQGCTFGLARHYNSIPLIAFATSGGCEIWSRGNTILGWVPDDNHSTVLERTVQPIYSHDGSGSNPIGAFASLDDRVWSGQHGWGSRPYVSPPPNNANPDDGTNNTIDTARCWVVGIEMDGGGYATRKNSGNTPRILSAQSGHVYVNCLYHSYAWDRTTDTTTIEYFEISTTDYDYRGWDVNEVIRIGVGAVTGTHNFALRRNNLGSGTDPDMQGAHEAQKIYCDRFFYVPSGLNMTGTWNRLSADQSGNILNTTLAFDNATSRECWFNGRIVNDSAANTSEDIVLGIPKAAAAGPRYTDSAAQTCRGGASRTMFYRCCATDVDQSIVRLFGTQWLLDNAQCFAASAFTAAMARPGPTAQENVEDHEPLPAHCGNASGLVRLEYDHYGTPRLDHGARAVGAIERGHTTPRHGRLRGRAHAIRIDAR